MAEREPVIKKAQDFADISPFEHVLNYLVNKDAGPQSRIAQFVAERIAPALPLAMQGIMGSPSGVSGAAAPIYDRVPTARSPFTMHVSHSKPLPLDQLKQSSNIDYVTRDRGMSAYIIDALNRDVAKMQFSPKVEQLSFGPEYNQYRNVPTAEVAYLRNYGAKQGMSSQDRDARSIGLSGEQLRDVGGMIKDLFSRMGTQQVEFVPLWTERDIVKNLTDSQSARSKLYGRMLGGKPEAIMPQPGKVFDDTVRIKLGSNPPQAAREAQVIDPRQIEFMLRP